MSKNIGAMTPDQVEQFVNYNKAYAVFDQLQGIVQIFIMPNDAVARRTFVEMCSNAPDTTVDNLKLCDLGLLADIDCTVDITPRVGDSDV